MTLLLAGFAQTQQVPGPKHVFCLKLRHAHARVLGHTDEIVLREVDVTVHITAFNAARLALESKTFVHSVV